MNMNISNLFKAFKRPKDLYLTYVLFRRLGAGWKEALINAVNCIVLCRFVIS